MNPEIALRDRVKWRAHVAGVLVFGLHPLWGASAFAGVPADVTQASVTMPRPGFATTVLSMTVKARQDMELVGASSSIAQSIEMQKMVREGVEVHMARVDAIALPAGKEVQLRLGQNGPFLMAHKIKRTLKPGQAFPLTLVLRNPS